MSILYKTAVCGKRSLPKINRAHESSFGCLVFKNISIRNPFHRKLKFVHTYVRRFAWESWKTTYPWDMFIVSSIILSVIVVSLSWKRKTEYLTDELGSSNSFHQKGTGEKYAAVQLMPLKHKKSGSFMTGEPCDRKRSSIKFSTLRNT